MLPVEGLSHQRHGRAATTAEQDRRDRHAVWVLPLRSDRGALGSGRGEAGVGVSGGRVDLGGPHVAAPIRCPSRSLLGHALPPHIAIAGERGVGEDAVAVQRFHRVCVGAVAGSRGDSEESGLRIDRVQAAVLAELHPADVVADRLGLPAGDRRHEHRQVGLAARRREGGGDVLRLAGRIGELEDQHVLGQPAGVAGHDGCDAQREALLAEQRVAAVSGAVRHDLAGLGEVDDVLVVRVARP